MTQQNTVDLSGKFWGPDVSKWVLVRDWGRLIAGGATFFAAKATEGVNTIDPTFKDNQSNSRLHPELKLVVYYTFIHFEKSPEDQAERFALTLGDLRPNERLCCDFEDKSYSALDPSIVKAHGLEYLDRFYEHLDKLGLLSAARPMIYTSSRHWVAIGNPNWDRAKSMDLWTARYPLPGYKPPKSIPAPWSKWLVHQWTDGGKTGIYHCVPGIGPCDVNVVNEDAAA